MASLFSYNGGLKRIEFSHAPNGPRQIIRLGRMNAKQAGTIKAMVEAIVGDKLANRPHDAEVSKWLGQLDEKMLGRLRAVGLADGVGLAQTTLGAFLDRYTTMLTIKPASRVFYGHTRRNLEDYFGKTRLLRDVTAADADAWRAWLVEHEKLSQATVSRRVVAARTMWRMAVRWKLAGENPFVGVKTGHQCNDARKVFITRKDINKIIAEAPDTEWKLIIALCRYGGLRCPSEHYALKWGHIDFHRGTIRVPCPKLEHREGHAFRIVPLFPELRAMLLNAFDEADEGAEYVISKHRMDGMNLRTQFERIIDRAGLTPWPKLFHNLRASRETELMREYDLATVCKWIGNSPAVAAKHYATSVDLDADFRRAIGKAEQAQQKAQQSADGGACPGTTSTSPTNEKTPAEPGFVIACQSPVTPDVTDKWARQDSNL